MSEQKEKEMQQEQEEDAEMQEDEELPFKPYNISILLLVKSA